MWTVKQTIVILSGLLVVLTSTTVTSDVKEGLCPRATLRPDSECDSVTGQTCTNDGECGGPQKCCNTECANKNQCKYPVKRGGCGELINAVCDSTKPSCSNDLQCDGRLKCCRSACSTLQCQNPVLEKDGSCTRSYDIDYTDESCRRDCLDDYDCEGSSKCCYNGCTWKCT